MVFDYSSCDFPTKRFPVEIKQNFGGDGVDYVRIGDIRIGNDVFIQLIKDYMTTVPVSVCDNRLRLVEWFKSIKRRFKKGDPCNDYFTGTAFDKELGTKHDET
jgi:hypothetical protein